MSSATEKAIAPKAAKAVKPKKPAVKPSHPPTSVMVQAAISSLKERSGSSLPAIKKYIATNYKLDPVKHSHFIKKALKSGVEKKTLIQVKGTGASGSFKLAKVEKVKKKVAPKKSKPSSKTSASKAKKKTVKPKSAKGSSKKKAEKPKSAKKTSKPKKPVAKKAAKSVAKKPAKKPAPKKK